MPKPGQPVADWRTVPRSFWTVPELSVVREHYPEGGINACEPLLPGRSRASIYQKAGELGVRSNRIKVKVRRSYPKDAHVDEQIRFAHQSVPTKGYMQTLAERVGRPRWWVSKRARELGLTTPRFMEPAWSDEELAIVERTAKLTPSGSQKALERAGFHRSVTAVVVKRKRLDITIPKPAGVYCPNSLGALLGYDPKTPIRWIRTGQLRAVEKDGVFVIREADIRAFLLAHPMQVDLRKLPLLNRPWLYEVLTARRNIEKGQAA